MGWVAWESLVFSPPPPNQYCVLGNSSSRTSGAKQVPPAPRALEGRASSLCADNTGHVLFHCRHMVLLKEQYGKQVVVNLLGSRGGEEVLNRAFKVNAVLLTVRGGGRGG